MELIDRYLHAVRTYLPRGQQDDIIGELSEDLRAKAEERQSQLGRPLTLDDQAAILRPYGRPILLAARYRPKQYLIGPAMFPFYVNVLKIALSVALAAHAVLAVLLAVTGSPLSRSAGVIGQFPGVAIAILGWITVVFAIVDWCLPATPAADRWNPRSLPPVPGDRQAISRFDSGLGALVTAAAVCWWLAVPGNTWLILGPASEILAPGRGWDSAHLPILALLLASLVLSLLDLARPYRTRGRTVARMAAHAGSLALILWLTRAGDFVTLAAGAPATAATAVEAVNTSVRIGLVISAIIVMVDLGKDVLRLRRIAGPRVPSPV